MGEVVSYNAYFDPKQLKVKFYIQSKEEDGFLTQHELVMSYKSLDDLCLYLTDFRNFIKKTHRRTK